MLIRFFDRERTIARPGFNRWLVPPAALAVHLSIGQVYGYSVFKGPLSQLIGVTKSAPGDWQPQQIAYMFSIAIAVLGLSTAVFGKWIDKSGPRKVMFVAALCFGAGLVASSVGVRLHLLPLLYLGYGVVGGIGLGLGYLAPVATLVRWFPDRPGLATGMAIMGFGGGALIGSPLALLLMQYFGHGHTSAGAANAMAVMGAIYFVFMTFGALLVRVPAKDWKPEGWTPSPKPQRMITSGNVSVATAMVSPQFYLLWIVLCTNTTAGIGIIEQASPMIQQMFPGRVLEQAAAGFVGILSLFNMAGRFFWSSTSDYTGRKTTFMLFFLIGIPLYIGAQFAGAAHLDAVSLFVLICGVLLSMYGGGFSTLPAYVRDLFGAADFGSIYGRLLTAWSVAGILGPLLVNYISEYQIKHGVAPANAYATVLYVMSGILAVGLVANILIRPVRSNA